MKWEKLKSNPIEDVKSFIDFIEEHPPSWITEKEIQTAIDIYKEQMEDKKLEQVKEELPALIKYQKPRKASMSSRVMKELRELYDR